MLWKPEFHSETQLRTELPFLSCRFIVTMIEKIRTPRFLVSKENHQCVKKNHQLEASIAGRLTLRCTERNRSYTQGHKELRGPFSCCISEMQCDFSQAETF